MIIVTEVVCFQDFGGLTTLHAPIIFDGVIQKFIIHGVMRSFQTFLVKLLVKPSVDV